MECVCAALVILFVDVLLLPGLSCSDVVVDPQTQAILGRPVTLHCHFSGSGQVTQVTWDKMTELGPQMVAVRSQDHGTRTHPFYGSRAHFRVATSDPDASLVIQDVILADGGRFRCKIFTFPSGSFERDTWLTVLVPPQISVVPGPRSLLEGDKRALAATCTAIGSSPRAQVSWETKVAGEEERTITENNNGTVTISRRFYLDPVRSMQGLKITCLVNHSTFPHPTRLEHRINVYYVPEVSISRSSQNDNVGMEKAELHCEENGNPPASRFDWKRLDGALPNNTITQGNTLTFSGPLTVEDSGTYICEATNEIGSRSGQINIQITDTQTSGVNMLSMAFVAIGAVGLVLLIILVVSVIAVNRYHRKKTEEMVFKLEEISTMSRQPSIRRCNSMSASVDARLHDDRGSRENDLEQDPMLQGTLGAQQQQESNSRELLSIPGEGLHPPAALGNHRYSLRSTVSENQALPAHQFGAYRSSLTGIQRYSGRDWATGPGERQLPPPIPLGNHRDSTRDMTVTPEQVQTLTNRGLTPSPSEPDSQTEDEEEVVQRVQSIHAAMGHFYPHNGTLRAKPSGNGIYIARREHCV